MIKIVGQLKQVNHKTLVSGDKSSRIIFETPQLTAEQALELQRLQNSELNLECSLVLAIADPNDALKEQAQ